MYMDLRQEYVELYDLSNDRFQLESLHRDPAQAERMADMKAKLATLKTARGRAEFAAAEA